MAAIRKSKRTSTRTWLKKACAPRNSYRPILHTIHTFVGRRPGPLSVAADGYRLFVDYAPDVLPARNADRSYNAYHVYDKTEIEPGRFPDFQRIIPRTDSYTPCARFVVTDLQAAIKQARVIAKHNVDSIMLHWDHKEMTVFAKAPAIGDICVSVPLNYAEPGGDVTVKGKFLLDALSGMKHVYGWGRIYSPAPDVPIVVRPGLVDDLNGPDREAVIMPMSRN